MTDILYKYCGYHGLKILSEFQLKVTQPSEFNDPFEISPRFKTDFTLTDAYDTFTDQGRSNDVLEYMRKLGAPPHIMEVHRKVALLPEAQRKKAASVFFELMEEAVKAEVANTQRMFSEQYGILCLSHEADNILMWSHYADNHRGIVVGFHRDKLPSPERFLDVKYEPERFGVSPFHFLKEATSEDMTRMIFHKSPQWAYEREIRGVFELNFLTEIELPREKKGWVFTVPPESIACIILGARCDWDLALKVKTIHKWKKLACPILQSGIHSEEYRLTGCALKEVLSSDAGDSDS